MSSISLPSGMSANLLALQQTAAQVAKTQERLSTGKKINSALDNPLSYFASKALSSRANDLTTLKDSMGQAIQTLKAADKGINGIQSLIDSAKGLAQSAKSATSTTEAYNLSVKYDAVRTQINNLQGDSGYQGTNLLAGGSTTLKVTFNESGSASLSVVGIGSGSASLGITAASNGWASSTGVDIDLALLTTATSTLRTTASSLSADLSVITTRQDFTTNMVDTLKTGSDLLVNADMNEESANMLSLQTRQSLGISALSLSSQAAQSILKLF